MTSKDTIGVRELRNNLSVYLDRVKHGQSLNVTEWGQPIARVIPFKKDASHWEQMVAEGSVRLPPRPGILPDIKPLKASDDGPSTAEVLDEIREDKI